MRYYFSLLHEVLLQNGLSAMFLIFKVRAPSYNTKHLSNDTFLIIYKGIFFKLWLKVFQILFSLYFSSLNLKYLKLTKLDLTCFVMKLFTCTYEKTFILIYIYVSKNHLH